MAVEDVQPHATCPPLHGPVRVAHLVSHPIQYFAPLYRELAARPEIDLTVYFYSDASIRPFRDTGFGREIAWDTDLLSGYRSRFCPSARNVPLDAGFLRPPSWDVIAEVVRGRYDVVWAHGYAHLTTWIACVAARLSGARALMREEQTLLPPRPAWKRALKQPALRSLFALCAGLYIGEQNRRYFRHYGIPDSRLFPARYCVDNRFFHAKALELVPRRRQARAKFGIVDNGPVVLFCGKLHDAKQPLLLLEAFARVRERHHCWLLVVGDGPLRAKAEELVLRRRIPDVRFAGFLNQSELPAAYVAADLFVLPSLAEPWGLVVNEAMNFGLPVIVSDQVGCAEDLVRPGWNGFVVPHDDVGAFADAIERLVADEELRRADGARSRELVEGYSIEACAEGVVAACLATAGRAGAPQLAEATG